MPEDAPHTNARSSDYDIRLFAKLLRPSTLSTLVCLLISLFVVAGVAVMVNYRGSSFEQDLLGFQQRQEREKQDESAPTEEVVFIDENGVEFVATVSLADDYQQINDSFANNSIVRNIPVMVFWMFVGVLVYFIVTGIAGALASAKAIDDELHYVNTSRKALLKEVYIKTGIRLATLIVWLLYIMLFFRVILPYVLAAANIGGSDILSIRAVPYTLLAFAVLAIALHLHLMLLRLVMLRPRLFSEETSF